MCSTSIMFSMEIRGVGKLCDFQKCRPNPMKGYRDFYYSHLHMGWTSTNKGVKDMIVLSISNFTKLWQLEEKCCYSFYIFCFYNLLYKIWKSIAKFTCHLNNIWYQLRFRNSHKWKKKTIFQDFAANKIVFGIQFVAAQKFKFSYQTNAK